MSVQTHFDTRPSAPSPSPRAGAAAGGSPPRLTQARSAGFTLTKPRGHAPNHGAHRLAWWLSRKVDAGVARLERASVEPASIDRMLEGDLVPSDDAATAIALATEGAVRPMDWDAAPGPDWLTEPRERAH